MPVPIALFGLLALGAIALAAGGGSKTPAPAGAAGGPNPPGVLPILDATMPAETANAVRTALAHETDPAKLRAFVTSLLPEYPIAAALLNAKAAALSAGVPLPGVPAPAPMQPGLPPMNGGPLITVPTILGVPSAAAAQAAAMAAQAAQAAQAAAAQAVSYPTVPPTPPQAAFPLPGSHALVSTTDVGTAGQLAIRQTPVAQGTPPQTPPDSNIIGYAQHGSIVIITGPPLGGFYPINSNNIVGFSSAQYLSDPNSGQPAASAAAQTPGAISVPSPTATYTDPNSILSAATNFLQGVSSVTTGDPYIVTTASDPLNLRATADVDASGNATGAIIGSNAQGTVVQVVGPAQNGMYPVSTPAGDGWSSAQYLTPQGGSVSAGFAGPSMYEMGNTPEPLGGPVMDLKTSALALNDALVKCGCRSYNEPKVKDFQRSAARAGIYRGPIDGFYGTTVQASLSKLVGPPAPPCFPDKGGPLNPNEYWSPIGT